MCGETERAEIEITVNQAIAGSNKVAVYGMVSNRYRLFFTGILR